MQEYVGGTPGSVVLLVDLFAVWLDELLRFRCPMFLTDGQNGDVMEGPLLVDGSRWKAKMRRWVPYFGDLPWLTHVLSRMGVIAIVLQLG